MSDREREVRAEEFPSQFRSASATAAIGKAPWEGMTLIVRAMRIVVPQMEFDPRQRLIAASNVGGIGKGGQWEWERCASLSRCSPAAAAPRSREQSRAGGEVVTPAVRSSLVPEVVPQD